MAYSILEALSGLETEIRRFVPRCAFYLGDEQKNRDASPPKIIWDIDGGDPAPTDGVTGLPQRPFAGDDIGLAAVVCGEGKITQAEKDQRRADFAATEHLLRVLEWCIKKSSSAGFLGKSQRGGWTSISPEGPSDRGWPVEVRFTLRLILLPPHPLEVQPETMTVTPEIE